MNNTVHIIATKHKINLIKDLPTEGGIQVYCAHEVATCFEYIPIEYTVTILNNDTLERTDKIFDNYLDAEAYAKPFQEYSND